MQIKIHQPQLVETQEPPQMNRGGDLDSYKRNNSIVEPRKMFFGGVIERVAQKAAAEAAARGDLSEEELAEFNDMYGPSASEAAGFNPVATMNYSDGFADSMGLFDDVPDSVRERVYADREAARLTQEERDALTEEARRADAAEAAELLQRQLERNEYVDPLTPGEIDLLISGGKLTSEQAALLTQNYEVTEDQLAQLFSLGLLTEDQIREIIGQEIGEAAEEEAAEGLTRLTEEQVNELVQQGLAGLDMSNYATQADIQGLEALFQNYLTPEQLEAYLPTKDTSTIDALTKRIADLEAQYSNVTSQYEADAVNQQIADAKQEVSNFFASSAPTGPRTGSTSQFDSGVSFLPGGSPMATLIEGQREGMGQDKFTSYLKTFTPSYSDYEEPFSAEEYNRRSQPFTGGMYNNPFTGGMSYKPPGKSAMGGQVSNGIMDLTNFETNVQPFQNAFRPNVPRN